MNMLLADVQSLNVNSPESTTVTGLAGNGESDGEFPKLMTKQLEQNVEMSPRLEFPQVVDLKELISDSDLSPEIQLEIDLSIKPPAVTEVLMNADNLHTTAVLIEPVQNPMSGQVEIPAAIEIENLSPAIGDVALGDELPVSGNTLPPLPTVENARPIEARSVPVDPALAIKPDLKKASDHADIEADAELSNRLLNQSGDLREQIGRQIDGKTVFQPVLQTDVMAIKTSESPVIQTTLNEVADLAGNVARNQHPGLTLTTTGIQHNNTLPAALETLAVNQSRDTAAWGNGIGERVQWMINQKLNTATIRLDPPMLGRLDVHIQVNDDVTNVTINTHHAQTREIIDNASFRLRHYLQENGYQNVNVDVSHQEAQQQQPSDQLNDDSTHGASGRGTGGDMIETAVDNDVRFLAADYIVDYFA